MHHVLNDLAYNVLVWIYYRYSNANKQKAVLTLEICVCKALDTDWCRVAGAQFGVALQTREWLSDFGLWHHYNRLGSGCLSVFSSAVRFVAKFSRLQ